MTVATKLRGFCCCCFEEVQFLETAQKEKALETMYYFNAFRKYTRAQQLSCFFVFSFRKDYGLMVCNYSRYDSGGGYLGIDSWGGGGGGVTNYVRTGDVT